MEDARTVQLFASLAYKMPQRILMHLTNCGDAGLPAKAISELVAMLPGMLSFHLKDMQHAGLLHCRREGRRAIYSPNIET